MAPANIFVLTNGAAWATDGHKAWLEQPVAAADVLVDGRLVGEVGAIEMRDRQRLSQDGFIVALIPVNARNQLVGEPELISRGFLAVERAPTCWPLRAMRSSVSTSAAKVVAHDAIRDHAAELLLRETQSRPVVLPSLVQVRPGDERGHRTLPPRNLSSPSTTARARADFNQSPPNEGRTAWLADARPGRTRSGPVRWGDPMPTPLQPRSLNCPNCGAER